MIYINPLIPMEEIIMKKENLKTCRVCNNDDQKKFMELSHMYICLKCFSTFLIKKEDMKNEGSGR